MYFIIYKITNKINGKYYVGSHKTKNLDDNYMGSGKYLQYAQEKYGIENFEKEILFVFDTAAKMYQKEAEIVNTEFLVEENTYNLKIGGFGGFDYINSSGINNKANQCSKAGKAAAAKGGGFKGKQHTTETRKRMSEKRWGPANPNYGMPGTFKGKFHSNETKNKISLSNKGKCVGIKNSQYGTMWVTNGIENKKIPVKELDNYIKLGYNRGRVLKGSLSSQGN